MKTSEINFTSRIFFVPETKFDALNYGKYINLQFPYEKPLSTKGSNILISGIRTCTGGVISNTKSGNTAAFHLYDNSENMQHIDEFIKELFSLVPNADKAMLVGGKPLKLRIYSMKLFNKIKHSFKNSIKDITIFEKHKYPNSETNLFYNAQDDTFFINTLYSPYSTLKCNDVNTLEELIRAYGKIKIAKQDKIYIKDKPVFYTNA